MRFREILGEQLPGNHLQVVELVLIAFSMTIAMIALKHHDYMFAVLFVSLGVVYPLRRASTRKKRYETSPPISFGDGSEIEEESDSTSCRFNGNGVPEWIRTKEFGLLEFMCTAPINDRQEVNIGDLPEGWKIIYKSGVFG